MDPMDQGRLSHLPSQYTDYAGNKLAGIVGGAAGPGTGH